VALAHVPLREKCLPALLERHPVAEAALALYEQKKELKAMPKYG